MTVFKQASVTIKFTFVLKRIEIGYRLYERVKVSNILSYVHVNDERAYHVCIGRYVT